jgi:hypothetical protein
MRVEYNGQVISYTESFFSSPDLFDGLHIRDIKRCGAVRQNCKGVCQVGFDKKTLQLKWGDRYPDSRDLERKTRSAHNYKYA